MAKRHGGRKRTASEKGYNEEWARVSRAYRREHPLCAMCERVGRLSAVASVDHIVPHRGNPDLFWSPRNWQGLCEPCHIEKTIWDNQGLIRHWTPPAPGAHGPGTTPVLYSAARAVGVAAARALGADYYSTRRDAYHAAKSRGSELLYLFDAPDPYGWHDLEAEHTQGGRVSKGSQHWGGSHFGGGLARQTPPEAPPTQKGVKNRVFC